MEETDFIVMMLARARAHTHRGNENLVTSSFQCNAMRESEIPLKRET